MELKTRIFKVSVRNGNSHDIIAVRGVNSAEEAERAVRSVGFRLLGATSYEIDEYGVRFAHKTLEVCP